MGMDGELVRLDDVRRTATHVGATALDRAIHDFDRTHPQRSARRVFYITQLIALAALLGGLIVALKFAPGTTLKWLWGGAFALFSAAILLRLVAAAHLKAPLWRLADPHVFPVYTILCPLYREANVIPDLLTALEHIDYPREALDIKFIVEGDDHDTIAATLAAAEAHHLDVVIVPPSAPRTKPKALNAALAYARGEYAVIYDAEDRPHPQQLRAALAAFEDGPQNLACVQAPLDIDNAAESWIARQFAAEYAILFREVLPLLARLKLPFPLGGTSNHFRVDALRRSGTWDPNNVTEDADLGYRLARDGYALSVIGPPTYEEAPISFGAWLSQRTRWIKGHMQTWLVLMRDPLGAARDFGFRGFAAMQLVLGGGLLAAFAHGPLACIVLIAALSPYNLLTPSDFALAVFGYCVAVFAALSAVALSGNLSHIRAALTMPFYWPLATIAALRALLELLVRPHHWSKTAHGLSRRTPPPLAVAVPDQPLARRAAS